MNDHKKVYFSKLHLENYRNFSHLEIEANVKPIIIIGENGNGKTNILESLSMLFPGRGLRSAKMEEICKQGTDYWRIEAIMQSKIGIAEVKSNYQLSTNKRLIEYNGSKIINGELNRLSNIIWLTPQMEGIFMASLTDRRRFFDRIVYSFIASHASLVSQYEHYLQERIKLLEQDFADYQWLDIIEDKIATHSAQIAKNRIEVLKQMQLSINNLQSPFPKALINISGFAEDKIKTEASEDQLIEEIKQHLRGNRPKDKAASRTLFGTHRSEFLVTHSDNMQLAKLCSTGQQKAMLISIMLAQITALINSTGYCPILLLDEVFVHLDDRRKKYLADFFLESEMQVWITATDLAGIEDIAKKAKVVEI